MSKSAPVNCNSITWIECIVNPFPPQFLFPTNYGGQDLVSTFLHDACRLSPPSMICLLVFDPAPSSWKLICALAVHAQPNQIRKQKYDNNYEQKSQRFCNFTLYKIFFTQFVSKFSTSNSSMVSEATMVNYSKEVFSLLLSSYSREGRGKIRSYE